MIVLTNKEGIGSRSLYVGMGASSAQHIRVISFLPKQRTVSPLQARTKSDSFPKRFPSYGVISEGILGIP